MMQRSIAGLLIVLAVFGCGTAQQDLMIPVSGRVTFGGKALTKGSITLHADATKGNTTKHVPHATIEADGTYRVLTHPQEGAPAGAYKVTVQVTEPSDPKNMYSPPRSVIPEKYGNPDESKLTIDVRSNAPPGAYDLHLK